MIMKELYIIRHCKAEGQDREAPLTAQGVEDARSLAQFLDKFQVEQIYSSPFRRAIQTIQPFADQKNINIHLDERLSERLLSTIDLPNWLELYRRTFDELDLCFEGGESSRATMDRAVSLVHEVLETGDNRICFVTHGGLTSMLLKYYNNQFHFEDWQKMSNPDVFRICFVEGVSPRVERIWRE